MTLTRRNLFSLLPALGAAAAVGMKAETPTDAVKPIILEHVCDHGASLLTAEELREVQTEAPWRYKGCGTRFQWHFGVQPYCPKCGWAYESSITILKSGRYRIVQGKIPG